MKSAFANSIEDDLEESEEIVEEDYEKLKKHDLVKDDLSLDHSKMSDVRIVGTIEKNNKDRSKIQIEQPFNQDRSNIDKSHLSSKSRELIRTRREKIFRYRSTQSRDAKRLLSPQNRPKRKFHKSHVI